MKVLLHALLVLILFVLLAGNVIAQDEYWQRHSLDEQMDIYTTEGVYVWQPINDSNRIESFAESVQENYNITPNREAIEASIIGDWILDEFTLAIIYQFGDEDAFDYMILISKFELEISETTDIEDTQTDFLDDLQDATDIEFRRITSANLGVSGFTYTETSDNEREIALAIPYVYKDSMTLYTAVAYTWIDTWSSKNRRTNFLVNFTSFTPSDLEYSMSLFKALNKYEYE